MIITLSEAKVPRLIWKREDIHDEKTLLYRLPTKAF